MAEATKKDLAAAEQALYRIMHLARLTLHAMENVELTAAQPGRAPGFFLSGTCAHVQAPWPTARARRPRNRCGSTRCRPVLTICRARP